MTVKNPLDVGRVVRCLVATAAVAAVSPALAQGAPDFSVDLPSGLACTGFDLRLEARGELPKQHLFTDKNGTPVRFIQAGRGWSLTLINLNSGASINLRPTGSVAQARFLPDGTQEWSTGGHNLLIWFPSDIPAGPWTRMYIGRLTYSVRPDGVFVFGKASGRTIDICAALG